MVDITLETKGVLKSLKQVRKESRVGFQESIGYSLTRARLRASEYIIKNTTGTFNPSQAYKKQPSTPGRLTSRTGKLAYMLKQGASVSNPLKSWKNVGNILLKEDTVGLKGLVRAQRDVTGSESYIGSYRIFIRGNGVTERSGHIPGKGYMPKATKQQLRLRFMWELGIRGEKRAFFAPTLRESEFDLKRLAEMRQNRILKAVL